MDYEQPRPTRRRILGIILLFTTLVMTGMFALTGYTIIASFFVNLQPSVNQLPAGPQAIVNSLKTQVNNAFSIAVVLIVIAAIAGVVFAIFSLGRRSEEGPVGY